MARLVLEARTAEWTSGDVVREWLVGVAVSRADDGKPVSGLAAENFRVAAQFGDFSDFAVDQVREWEWEPGDAERSRLLSTGDRLATLCRHPWARDISTQRLETHQRVALRVRVQARTFDEDRPGRVVDKGQTIVEATSQGE